MHQASYDPFFDDEFMVTGTQIGNNNEDEDLRRAIEESLKMNNDLPPARPRQELEIPDIPLTNPEEEK